MRNSFSAGTLESFSTAIQPGAMISGSMLFPPLSDEAVAAALIYGFEGERIDFSDPYRRRKGGMAVTVQPGDELAPPKHSAIGLAQVHNSPSLSRQRRSGNLPTIRAMHQRRATPGRPGR